MKLFDGQSGQFKLKNLWKSIACTARGLVSIFVCAFKSFGDVRAPEAAAGLAYYTLFSLFPLMLVFVIIGSFFVDRALVEQELLEVVPRLIPIAPEIITKNVVDVFEMRGSITIVAFVSLFWSSTSVFAMLVRNINIAWQHAGKQSFFHQRLLAFAIVGSLTILLFVTSMGVRVLELFSIENIPFWRSLPVFGSTLGRIGTYVVSILGRAIVFFGLYWWVPRVSVKKSAAAWGSIISSLTWEGITYFFNYYLTSGFVRYELIYGSLGKIVAFLAWIYFISWTILFGAHLSAAIDDVYGNRSNPPPLPAPKSGGGGNFFKRLLG